MYKILHVVMKLCRYLHNHELVRAAKSAMSNIFFRSPRMWRMSIAIRHFFKMYKKLLILPENISISENGQLGLNLYLDSLLKKSVNEIGNT